jgi:nitroreductase
MRMGWLLFSFLILLYYAINISQEAKIKRTEENAMKNFLSLAKERYSVRKYKDTPVETEKLNSILEAGRIAPSACNFQPWVFLVINDTEGMAALAKGCNPFGAPLAVIICADTTAAWVRKYDQENHGAVDATIATDHMMLCAQDLGLSTCWICWFDPAVIRAEFNIPAHLVPVNILPIGYADEEPQSPDRHDEKRKPLAEIVKYGGF